MSREKTEEISILRQTIATLEQDAERLRMAHIWGREYHWRPAEDEATLHEAAQKVERFRQSLMRFAHQRGPR
jgi:hypothetical protein